MSMGVDNVITPSNQQRHTNVAVVRTTKKGMRFEIACYRNKVLSWRSKAEVDLGEVLQVDSVFTNVGKGQLASKKDLIKAFGTAELEVVIKELLDHGEMQVSEKERDALMESMFRDVAAIVVDKAVNPENNRPYTISMIQTAMKEIHYSVHTNKGAKSQALDVIRKLKTVMPIARAKMRVKVSCPASVLVQVRAAVLGETAPAASAAVPSVLIAVEHTANLEGGDKDKDAEAEAETKTETEAGAGAGAGAEEAIGSMELLLESENYRPLQLIVERLCGSKGYVEVLQLNASSGVAVTPAPTIAAAPVFASAAEDEDEDEDGVPLASPSVPSTQGTKPQKVSKKAKRAEKEAQAEREVAAAALKERVRKDQSLDRNERRNTSSQELASGDDGDDKEETADSAVSASSKPASVPMVLEAPVDGKACNTCGGCFDPIAYRAHFRSEWHRFNLKLKLLNQPPLTNEAAFLALSVSELSLVNKR